MGQFSDPVATHPRTNEVEVPPPGLPLLIFFNRKLGPHHFNVIDLKVLKNHKKMLTWTVVFLRMNTAANLI